MKIGAHVSTSGGLDKAVQRGLDIGADCIQIFVTSPQMWRMHQHKDATVEAFLEGLKRSGIGPVLIHAIYLINLAAESPELRKKSIDSLVAHLEWADRLGALGVCTHIGSYKLAGRDAGMSYVVDALKEILDRAPGRAPLLLETTENDANSVGGQFEDIGELIARADHHSRLQVCLDTAHVFEAGYPLTTPEEVADTVARFDQAIGLDRLTALHLNDSKTPFGSHRDRHENIGEGYIGISGFAAIVNNPDLSRVPGFLEVPGFTGEGPDAENIQRLRNLTT